MNDYLKSIDNVDITDTNASFDLKQEGPCPVFELSKQTPTITAFSEADNITQSLQENFQYLLPQKIRIRKYTLKKD